MKNFKWIYFFIWLGFGGCLGSLVMGIILNKEVIWEICTMGWIATTYFLQRKIDEYESKK